MPDTDVVPPSKVSLGQSMAGFDGTADIPAAGFKLPGISFNAKGLGGKAQQQQQPKRTGRMKAEDMFGESDEE
jgi:hypothetical protein